LANLWYAVFIFCHSFLFRGLPIYCSQLLDTQWKYTSTFLKPLSIFCPKDINIEVNFLFPLKPQYTIAGISTCAGDIERTQYNNLTHLIWLGSYTYTDTDWHIQLEINIDLVRPHYNVLANVRWTVKSFKFWGDLEWGWHIWRMVNMHITLD